MADAKVIQDLYMNNASRYDTSPKWVSGFTTGSGAPTLSATKGAIYYRTDTPTTANQRIYINSSAVSGTTWTALL